MTNAIKDRLHIFRETTEWIFSNIDMINSQYTGIIAVYNKAVIAADQDVDHVKSLALASGYPPEDIVLMFVDDPMSCCGGIN
jgi:hypothetical protein